MVKLTWENFNVLSICLLTMDVQTIQYVARCDDGKPSHIDNSWFECRVFDDIFVWLWLELRKQEKNERRQVWFQENVNKNKSAFVVLVGKYIAEFHEWIPFFIVSAFPFPSFLFHFSFSIAILFPSLVFWVPIWEIFFWFPIFPLFHLSSCFLISQRRLWPSELVSKLQLQPKTLGYNNWHVSFSWSWPVNVQVYEF